ncbi:MAG: hypothetical protein K9L76_02245 [Candidatus Omnitrophica bacterium]|nr:hypothetical protein [Candidatus Omnitrophota bacterium]
MKANIKKGKDWVKLTVNSSVYPLTTIYSAGYIFLDKAYIYLDKETKNKIAVFIYPKKKSQNLDKIAGEFYNELLNYAHYYTSLKANADAVKMLMQRALFSAEPSLAKEAEEEEIADLIKELEEEEDKSREK